MFRGNGLSVQIEAHDVASMVNRLSNSSPSPSWGDQSVPQRDQLAQKNAARPAARKPAGLPSARMITPWVVYAHQGKQETSNDLIRRLSGVSRLFGNLNPQQKNAVKDMHRLLGPDKFGGRDRTLNYGDTKAIRASLLEDKQGLKKMAVNRLQRHGKNFRAGLVQKAFSDRPALIGGVVKNRVLESAANDIDNRLDRLLKKANVDSKTSSYYDDQPRNVSFKDAARFQKAFNVFRSMQRQTEKNLGVKLVYPKGISQDFMKHLMEERAGFPPGVSFREPNK